MQFLKRPKLDTEVVKRVKLNQDYGLIQLNELVIERVRTHLEDSECYTQVVEPQEPEITVYEVWLGDEDGNEYTSIQCGQDGKLCFWAECWFCYVDFIDFECYAGPDTGWENLIGKLEDFPIGCGDGCYDFVRIGMMVPWYGEGDPRNGDVAEFLSLAGLDCMATQVKVCGKVIYKG